MKTCICSIIKDEQQYLDEWIKYHLNVGIDHIYLFEDIDSCSHKHITDQYNNVTLLNINDVLDDKQKEEAINLKRYKKYSSHYLYLRALLLYMKQFDFDWCFPIDVDEFISTDVSILSNYSNYDAVILYWKCYGASKLINKPDYNKGGVLDYFTEETLGYIPEKISCSCKTCYNLKKYQPSYLNTPHTPSELCNYCNTNFEKTIDKLSLDNIYLKHYITKSWEEYVWKINVRGFMWGGRRNYDFFFQVNPELNYMKQKLINDLNKKYLVVMPYYGRGAQGREIEIMLKCWRKFCRFNYEFIVIGEYPNVNTSDFPWVTFIPLEHIKTVPYQYTPHLDIINKFKYIIDNYKDKYDGFIYVTDDEYAIKPFTIKDITTVFYLNPTFEGRKDEPVYSWNHDKWKTRQLLDVEGLPHINYTTHYPCYFEFDKFKDICDKYNLYNESYVFDDVYWNYYEHEEPIQVDNIRLGIWSKDIYLNNFKDALTKHNIKFVCNSYTGWSKELEESLLNLING